MFIENVESRWLNHTNPFRQTASFLASETNHVLKHILLCDRYSSPFTGYCAVSLTAFRIISSISQSLLHCLTALPNKTRVIQQKQPRPITLLLCQKFGLAVLSKANAKHEFLLIVRKSHNLDSLGLIENIPNNPQFIDLHRASCSARYVVKRNSLHFIFGRFFEE